ncbi:shikimate dehydrogenase family protein [Marinilactibacillus kalidii]|uniref:shikimate dehydrogenase family protein n=1 Tax=Marinilactibacillus kalidii TaxID=2820274 RepID=UPI001ABE2989|nr:shikimate dehydrogenase [Marinilactibacillus kalidii]
MHFYGLFGESLSHSLSPQLHQLIYQKLGIEAAYKPFAFEPKLMAQAIAGVRALSIDGVNVTIPYKETVIPYLDEMDILANQLNAVNTIEHKDQKLIGHNTDYAGFGLIFDRRNWKIEGKRAVLLGTGGAAKTVEAYLIDHGIAHLTIVSRSPERFENTEKISYTNYESLSHLTGDYLINSTPVGMYPNSDDTPVDDVVIENFDTLIDLIYNPKVTRFLEIGHTLAKQTANGLDMLIGQGVRAVEIWENCVIEDTIIEELIEHFQKEIGEQT